MKKLLLSVLLLSCSMELLAQAPVKKSSLFLDFGPSFAVGEFASKDISSDKAGLAGTGLFIDLGYQYQFSKNVGVIGMVQWKANGIDEKAFNYSVPTGSGGSISILASSWKMGAILGGFTQVFPLSKSETFCFELREMAGVQFTSSPEIVVSYDIPTFGKSTGKQETQTAASFAYLVGLGFKYQISKVVGLRLFGDYNNSSVSFKELKATSNGTTVTVPDSKQNTGSINTGLGLVISL